MPRQGRGGEPISFRRSSQAGGRCATWVTRSPVDAVLQTRRGSKGRGAVLVDHGHLNPLVGAPSPQPVQS
jgi:hypothetical protein